MNSLATNQIEIRATAVRVSNDALIIDLTDGRTVSAPLAWYPRLLHGSAAEWQEHQLIGQGLGIHGRNWTKTSAWKESLQEGRHTKAGLVRGVARLTATGDLDPRRSSRKHYRLHPASAKAGIAIDRFDGTIVGQQLEEVTE